MSKKTTGTKITFYMTLAVLAGFATILLMNAAALLGVMPYKYISPYDVRGVAVQHNSKLYTLNFSQQQELVDILNRSIPVGEELVKTRKINLDNPPEVEKIIVYRFNASDLEIVPVAYISKTHSTLKKNDAEKYSVVYSVPEWNINGFLEESTSDDLVKLLSSTYSP